MKIFQYLPKLIILIGITLSLGGCAAFNMLRPVHLDYKKYTSEEHNDFGVVYQESKNYKEAVLQFKRAIKKEPDNYIAYTNLGNVYFTLKKKGQAEKAYQKAIQLKDDYVPALNNLSNFYLQLKHPRIDQALKLLHKAEQQKNAKEIAYVYESMGIAYKKKGKSETAREYFKKALDKAPNDDFKKRILQELG